MKITIEIPDDELADAIRFTQARPVGRRRGSQKKRVLHDMDRHLHSLKIDGEVSNLACDPVRNSNILIPTFDQLDRVC